MSRTRIFQIEGEYLTLEEAALKYPAFPRPFISKHARDGNITIKELLSLQAEAHRKSVVTRQKAGRKLKEMMDKNALINRDKALSKLNREH